jgi:hypothetical protein
LIAFTSGVVYVLLPLVQLILEDADSSVVHAQTAELGECAEHVADPHVTVLTENACDEGCCVSEIVNVAVPLPLAVPVIAPVDVFSVAHDGREPALTENVSPVQFPVAEVLEYDWPTTASGMATVVKQTSGIVWNTAFVPTARL